MNRICIFIVTGILLFRCNSTSEFYYPGTQSIKKKCVYNKDLQICTEYFLDGSKKREYTLKNNLKDGILTKYDSSINKIQKYTYKNDTLNGLFEEYLDGKIIRSGHFVDGTACGFFDIYSDNKVVERREFFSSEKGVFINQRTYHIDGKVDSSRGFYYFIDIDSLNSEVIFKMKSYFEQSLTRRILLGEYKGQSIESFIPQDTINLDGNEVSVNMSDILPFDGGVFVETTFKEDMELQEFKEMFFRFDNPCLSNMFIEGL